MLCKGITLDAPYGHAHVVVSQRTASFSRVSPNSAVKLACYLHYLHNIALESAVESGNDLY